VGANVILALASLAVTALLLEGAFRAAPRLLPRGVYGSGRHEPALGMNVHGSPVLYNKVRFVRRTPNRHGFMDVEHEHAKPPGVLRVGIFGDSFVEALQVPLEVTFFRQLQAELPESSSELLAFGISGWGTLHSLLNYELQAERFDLDVVVYVFVENDPGNNLHSVSGMRYRGISPRPFAIPSDEPRGYALRWARRDDGDTPAWYRPVKEAQERSLLLQVFYDRLRLLRQEGVRTKARRGEAEMTEVSGSVPRATDLTATWPAVYRTEAAWVLRSILGEWLQNTRELGQIFLVLYVPRSEPQLRGKIGADKTWLPTLTSICDDLGIALVDPGPALARRLAEGVRIYDDHWTPDGHAVVARELGEALRPRLEGLRAGRAP
jgi:hypothetical protein